LICFYKKV
jgi:hypothetical protein